MGELPCWSDLLLWEAAGADQQVKHSYGQQVHEQIFSLTSDCGCWEVKAINYIMSGLMYPAYPGSSGVILAD